MEIDGLGLLRMESSLHWNCERSTAAVAKENQFEFERDFLFFFFSFSVAIPAKTPKVQHWRSWQWAKLCVCGNGRGPLDGRHRFVSGEDVGTDAPDGQWNLPKTTAVIEAPTRGANETKNRAPRASVRDRIMDQVAAANKVGQSLPFVQRKSSGPNQPTRQ